MMIFKLLLNTQIIRKMFIRISKNTVMEKKRKILLDFDDVIADMINNKKLNPVVTKLFIKGRKLNISIVFIIQ